MRNRIAEDLAYVSEQWALQAAAPNPPSAPAPEGLDELIARIKRAEQEVFDLCSGKRRWTMTVPAEPERDSDLLIGGALADARKALVRLSETES